MITVHYYDAAREKKVPKDAIVLSEHVREVLDALAVADRALDMSGSPQSATRSILRVLADQIEAQTKPPRIPEPGLWGVVEASTESNPYRTTFVRYPSDTEYCWSNAIDTCKSWDFLIDPVLIRPGFIGEGGIG